MGKMGIPQQVTITISFSKGCELLIEKLHDEQIHNSNRIQFKSTIIYINCKYLRRMWMTVRKIN